MIVITGFFFKSYFAMVKRKAAIKWSNRDGFFFFDFKSRYVFALLFWQFVGNICACLCS